MHESADVEVEAEAEVEVEAEAEVEADATQAEEPSPSQTAAAGQKLQRAAQADHDALHAATASAVAQTTTSARIGGDAPSNLPPTAVRSDLDMHCRCVFWTTICCLLKGFKYQDVVYFLCSCKFRLASSPRPYGTWCQPW